jgi:DNA-binding transcriptional LysR family regulator
MLNLHHLELFYYVAKHEGIVQACRHIPYGVQQPAVSAQIIRLEDEVGASLFRRRPFQLTATGRELFDSIAPFFSSLPQLEARLRGESVRTLRIVGLSEVLRGHAPQMLARLKKRHKGLQITVLEAGQKEAEELILKGEADLAVTVLDEAPPTGLQSKRLLRMPLVLWVPEQSSWRSGAEAIAAGAAGRLDLISLAPHELLPRLFGRGLKKLRREWSVAIEVSSADLIGPYVLSGLGAGLSVSSPHITMPRGLRELPLKGFPQLSIGAFWAGRPSPVAVEFLSDLAAVARDAG